MMRRQHATTFKVLMALGVVASIAGISAPTSAQNQPEVRADTAYGCLVCHAEKRRSFTMGIHSERGMRCNDCHGGNPAALELPAAHRGQFLGNPTKLQTVEMCSACHADANQMRQYGLPADQLAEFRTSLHGQLLLQRRNFDAPTCSDCHDAHTILPPEDARSNVFPTNIPGTCARCHDDDELMARYDIPTGQLDVYRRSAHGESVFDGQNYAAPTCVGCHGSHAALPPNVVEITNVCDRCHVLIGQAFKEGPHAEAASEGAFPGCLGCHSNHGTEQSPPDSIASKCGNCHAPETRAAIVATELQEQTVRAFEELAMAEEAIDELIVGGTQVSEERFRYQNAVTNYLQMAQVHHSIDLERLDELSRQVRSNTELVRRTAEIQSEHRWEHRLFLIPVCFLTLAAVLFSWIKLRELGD